MKKIKDKTVLIEDVRRIIRLSIGNRAKESLIVDFINQTDLDKMGDKATVVDVFLLLLKKNKEERLMSLQIVKILMKRRQNAI